MKTYRKINKREQEKRLEWVKLSYAYRKSMKRISWKNRMTFETFCELWETWEDPSHKNFEDEILGIALLKWVREEREKMNILLEELSWKNRNENGMSPEVHNGNTSKRMNEKKSEKRLDNDVWFWYNISREWREIANPASLTRHDRVSEIVNASLLKCR